MIEQLAGAAQKSKGVVAHRTVFQYEPIGISPLVEDEDAFNNITLRGHGQSKEVMKGEEYVNQPKFCRYLTHADELEVRDRLKDIFPTAGEFLK